MMLARYGQQRTKQKRPRRVPRRTVGEDVRQRREGRHLSAEFVETAVDPIVEGPDVHAPDRAQPFRRPQRVATDDGAEGAIVLGELRVTQFIRVSPDTLAIPFWN